MSFLFPLFLAAGAAIIVPLLLHLRRQPPTNVTEFSSLLFLQPTPQVTTTKRKLERWLLLLLRCLALLLLALMFARPYRASETVLSATGDARAVVILLDQSASMSRADLWPQANERAIETIAALRPQDRISIGTFDTSARQRISFRNLDAMGPAERASLVRAALAEVKPIHSGTAIDQALISATTWLEETRISNDDTATLPSSREIVLISDLQEGASLAALNAFTWPEDVTLSVEQVSTDAIDYRALALAASDETLSTSDDTEVIRLRLTNAAEADAATFTLKMDDDPTALTTGEISSGATRILRVPRPKDDKPHTFKLNADDWPLDNLVYLAPHQPRRIKVAALADKARADDATHPFYYLKRALQPTRDVIPEFMPFTADTKADWLVIEAQELPSTLQLAARSHLDRGGRALLVVTEGASADTVEKLTGYRLTLAEAKVKNYALIAELNTDAPALEPFRDPRLSDLSRIHIWHHRVLGGLPEQAKTLMTFDDRSPALVDLPVGRGTVHLLATGWHPKDSQLAHSPHFIALLDGLLSQIPGSKPLEQQLLVGDQRGESIQQVVGHYEASGHRFAVNLPPDESRLTPLPVSAFTTTGIPLQSDASAADTKSEAVRLEHEALESRQQYWLLLLAALLWIIGLETWLAGRRATSQPVAA